MSECDTTTFYNTYTRSIPNPVTSIIVDGDDDVGTAHSSLSAFVADASVDVAVDDGVVNAVLTPRITSPTNNPACSAYPLAVTEVMKTIL